MIINVAIKKLVSIINTRSTFPTTHPAGGENIQGSFMLWKEITVVFGFP